jgi:hypothetical protein
VKSTSINTYVSYYTKSKVLIVMKMSIRSIFVIGLILAGFVYTPLAQAATHSVTFWERGIGADYSGTVAVINNMPTHVDDLLTCYTIVTETGIHFAYQSPLVVDSSKRYVWRYTTSDTTPLIDVQEGDVPVEIVGNVYGYYGTQYKVTFNSAGSGSTNYSGDVWVYEGDVAILASSSSGASFDSWSSTGSIQILNPNSPSATAKVSGPGTITAKFSSHSSYTITPFSAGHGSISPSAFAIVSEGDSKTFTFQPDTYYGVSQVLVDGLPVPVASYYTFTNVHRDHTLNVTFALDFAQLTAVTVNSTIIGEGFVLVDGVSITTPQTFSWLPGSVHNMTTTQMVSKETGVKYLFSSWSNGGTQTQNYTVPTSSETLTANYKTQYQLTVKTNFGTVSPSSGVWYDAGSKVSVTATAPGTVDGESYVFGGWKGSIGGYTGGSNPSGEIVVNSPVVEETVWEHIYELKVESPYGSVSGAGWYEINQIVHAGVVPTPEVVDNNHQIVFTGWGGDASGSGPLSNNLVMDGPKKAVALWTPQYRVVFTQSGLEAGSFGVGNAVILEVNNTKLAINDLPFRTGWINDGSTLNYQYPDTMTTSLGFVYKLGDFGALASPLVVKSSANIQAAYTFQTIVFQLLNLGILFVLLAAIVLVVFLYRRRNMGNGNTP